MESVNEDQPDQRLPLAPQDDPSLSSISRPMIFNPLQDERGSCCKELMQHQEEVGEINSNLRNASTDSSLKLPIWKKEDHGAGDNQKEYGSVKWMPSKMRMMRKMMSSEQIPSNHSMQKLEGHKHPSSSSLETDHSGNSSYGNSAPIRVCADCNTTKTPLWRSGPRGPKSLCNACGIRQRKARRAMAAAAAAAAAGDATVPVPDSPTLKSKSKLKDKRSIDGVVPIPFKKRFKVRAPPSSQGRKKICFEDLSMNLGSHSGFQQVFPQDEIKEAAILLMSLSYGVVHG